MVFKTGGSGGAGLTLCDAAPTGVAPDNVAGPGVATDASRCDHIHALPTGVPVDTGQVNAPGVANDVARSDHVHRTIVQVKSEHALVGSRPGINFDDTASIGASFAVGDDGLNDDVDVSIAVAYGIAPPAVTGPAGAAGVLDQASRADHTHALELAVRDEGAPQGVVHTIDFVGAGVTAAVAAGVATVTVPGGGGGGGSCAHVVATSTATQTSIGTWSTISGMSVPVAEGLWLVWFNADTDVAITGTIIGIRLGAAGAPIPDSDRRCDLISTRLPCSTQTVVNVPPGGGILEAVLMTGAIGTTFRDRSLIAVMCGGGGPG